VCLETRPETSSDSVFITLVVSVSLPSSTVNKINRGIPRMCELPVSIVTLSLVTLELL
jgi:hypothetical protein